VYGVENSAAPVSLRAKWRAAPRRSSRRVGASERAKRSQRLSLARIFTPVRDHSMKPRARAASKRRETEDSGSRRFASSVRTRAARRLELARWQIQRAEASDRVKSSPPSPRENDLSYDKFLECVDWKLQAKELPGTRELLYFYSQSTRLKNSSANVTFWHLPRYSYFDAFPFCRYIIVNTNRS